MTKKEKRDKLDRPNQLPGTALAFLVKRVRNDMGFSIPWQLHTVEAVTTDLKSAVEEKEARSKHANDFEIERAHFIKVGANWHRVYVNRFRLSHAQDALLTAALRPPIGQPELPKEDQNDD